VYVSQFDASTTFDILVATSIGFIIVLTVSVIQQGIYFIMFLNTAVVAEVLWHMILYPLAM
jgi:hypothetical protein